jgi:hypothetical protein
MRYNVFELGTMTGEPRKWAVRAGRGKYFPSTTTTDKAEAERQAAWLSAQWHMRQAEKLMFNCDIVEAKRIGHMCNNLIDDICDRLEVEDPDWEERDPRGWLA